MENVYMILAGAVVAIAPLVIWPRSIARFLVAAADGGKAFRASWKVFGKPEQPARTKRRIVDPEAELTEMQRDAISALVGMGERRSIARQRVLGFGEQPSLDALIRLAVGTAARKGVA